MPACLSLQRPCRKDRRWRIDLYAVPFSWALDTSPPMTNSPRLAWLRVSDLVAHQPSRSAVTEGVLEPIEEGFAAEGQSDLCQASRWRAARFDGAGVIGEAFLDPGDGFSAAQADACTT